jgi:Ran GTPase-activating protein (RanGAP) involved in mRNA processing and transport
MDVNVKKTGRRKISMAFRPHSLNAPPPGKKENGEQWCQIKDAKKCAPENYFKDDDGTKGGPWKYCKYKEGSNTKVQKEIEELVPSVVDGELNVSKFGGGLGSKYSIEFANVISKIIRNNPKITNINLSGNKINEKGAKIIANALVNNKNIIFIDLSDTIISNVGLDEFSNALINNTTVESINLHNLHGRSGAWPFPNDLSLGNGMKKIAEMLKINKTLKIINLSNNEITNDNVIILADALKENETLTHLNIGINKIGAKGVIEIADAIRKNKKTAIKYLDMTKMGIRSFGIPGTRAITEMIKNNSSLKTLILRMNSISYGESELLSQVLENNETLTSLDLSENSIDFLKISKALITNKTLSSLNISKINPFGYKGWKQFGEMIGINKTLIKINLSYNKIDDPIFTFLASWLKNNKKIEFLNLSYNNIGKEGIDAISKHLKNQKFLKEIDLSKNSITNGSMIKLLKIPPNLELIDLTGNQLLDRHKRQDGTYYFHGCKNFAFFLDANKEQKKVKILVDKKSQQCQNDISNFKKVSTIK